MTARIAPASLVRTQPGQKAGPLPPFEVEVVGELPPPPLPGDEGADEEPHAESVIATVATTAANRGFL